jgi:hypothetical protein
MKVVVFKSSNAIPFIASLCNAKHSPTSTCSPTGGILPVNVNYRHLEAGSDPVGDPNPPPAAEMGRWALHSNFRNCKFHPYDRGAIVFSQILHKHETGDSKCAEKPRISIKALSF